MEDRLLTVLRLIGLVVFLLYRWLFATPGFALRAHEQSEVLGNCS